MYLTELQLRQFRSHRNKDVVFDPGITIITGPNGSGKTNILEAIYVLCAGKSFRDSDEHLGTYDTNWWKVTGQFGDQAREARYQDHHKSFVIDGKPQARLGQRSRLPVVLFEPDDLMMMHGAPSGRRKFIDRLCASLDTSYGSTLRRYERVVTQRNTLLRTSGALDRDALFVWDVMLAELAHSLTTGRLQVIEQWNQHLGSVYSQIAQRDCGVQVRYQTTISLNSYQHHLMQSLASHLERDRSTGSTSVGPHRDDIEFLLDGKSCATSASRGEIRSLVLALKQYEAVQLSDLYAFPPLILLDDVFSELDTTRQQQLLEFSSSQMFITTTNSSRRTNQNYTTIRLLPIDQGSSQTYKHMDRAFPVEE